MPTYPSSLDQLNLEQQRKRAKDLLRAARAGDPAALARLTDVRRDAAARGLKLADAQLAIAREAGFDSWPRLVAALEERDVIAFRDAVRDGDSGRTRQLLAARHVRRRINDPLFAFGQRAAHMAATNSSLLAVLIDAGADLNLRSDWANGPYTVLDRADEQSARFLLSHGAALTPNVAARLGWFDELRRFVEADSAAVHARGGDGQQPLHEAKSVEIADFLLDRGADIDARCIDHRSTPAQYALVERPEVCRRLLERGATPDIFMAARLGDTALATRLLDAEPGCLTARINEPGYGPVPPLHIYCWSLGFHMSPHEVALKFGHRDVHQLLASRSPARLRLVNALLTGDVALATALVNADPAAILSLTPHDHSHLAYAIFYERFAEAELLLTFGLDPSALGVDGGTALHAACWVGHPGLVKQILARGIVPIDARDPTHGSTPLGWAAFGSVHRRSAGADYPAVADLLVAAGADVTAPGNRAGRTLLQMADGDAAMQQALRRHGAA